MGAFYNEIEPYAAQWLRNLAAAGHIASGVVDERSIEVKTENMRDATQAHFFSGIGVWSLALRSAGWPDDMPVWTGSCPCQPFSDAVAGRGGKKFDDKRHLWPEWYRLIREHRPPVIFGEQVASPAGLAWFDAVRADLERKGYAVGAADLCAAGVGAPHIRQRLFFVAIHDEQRAATARRLGDARCHRDLEHAGELPRDEGQHEVRASRSDHASVAASAARDPWRDAAWVGCSDGKARPIEPGTFPLAHGPITRVGRLRAYGNAIVAPLAQTFVEAVIDLLSEEP